MGVRDISPLDSGTPWEDAGSPKVALSHWETNLETEEIMCLRD